MKILNSSVHIDNLQSYHDCDLIDIAKRRGIHTSEVQDALIELDKQNLDVLTLAITDDSEAIEKGIDVIFATDQGNFVWHPDQEFELVENKDQVDPENLLDTREHQRKGFKGKNPWDYLRQGQIETYYVYQGNEETQEKRRETRESERNKNALTIKKAILDMIPEGIDAPYTRRSIYVNPRAHNVGLKLASGVVSNLGGVEEIQKVVDEVAAHLGITVSYKVLPNHFGRDQLIISVPYYTKNKEK